MIEIKKEKEKKINDKIDQNFNAGIEYKHENTEAYKEDSIATYIGLERIWREKWVKYIFSLHVKLKTDFFNDTTYFSCASLRATSSCCTSCSYSKAYRATAAACATGLAASAGAV